MTERLWARERTKKLDPRIEMTARVRAPAIRTASTNEDRLRVLWGAVGIGEDPSRAEKILEKLSTLESEVSS